MSRPEPPDPGAHPRELVGGAALRFGPAVVAGWCADLMTGRAEPEDPGLPPLTWLGTGAGWELGRTPPPDEDRYWPRVWGARGLLYVWIPEAAPAVLSGLGDRAWRVREMSAKLVRLRELGEAAELVAELAGPEEQTPRVRAAAARALGAVGEGEHAEILHDAEEDPDPAVRRAAGLALAELRRRLDRDL
ncbi:HEAT repeat domain-containing protein [Phytomonospora sp. NPDC050363]|uniref:HEAT repeat domain-containing protein n=1 Tax=Phytomonospora sp. NPDC050363 TaxID=3155642 RepID=UPI0033DF2E2E